MAFLTTLGVGDEVACAIVVNPRRDDTHIADTGQPITTPSAWSSSRPPS